MKNSAVDRLGERLRRGINAADLTALDSYRRGFLPAYDVVVDRIRAELGLEASGRPAKSTSAIVDKLRRGTMRLTQMQDIAGCRIVVPDIPMQGRLIATLDQMFEVTVVDRRAQPSHGYRAVHAIVAYLDKRVEIQIRTEMQQRWAEASEKAADTLKDIAIKYGAGDAQMQGLLQDVSCLICEMENFERGAYDKIERVSPLARMIAEGIIDKIQIELERWRKEVFLSLDNLFDTIRELEKKL